MSLDPKSFNYCQSAFMNSGGKKEKRNLFRTVDGDSDDQRGSFDQSGLKFALISSCQRNDLYPLVAGCSKALSWKDLPSSEG